MARRMRANSPPCKKAPRGTTGAPQHADGQKWRWVFAPLADGLWMPWPAVLAMLTLIGLLAIAAPAAAAWDGTIASLSPQYIQTHVYTETVCGPDWRWYDWDHRSCTTYSLLTLPDGTTVPFDQPLSPQVKQFVCYADEVYSGVDGCPSGVQRLWNTLKFKLGL